MYKGITELCLITHEMTTGALLVILILLPVLLVQNPEMAIIPLLTVAILLQVIQHTAIAHHLIQHTVHLLTVIHHTATALQPITAHIAYPLIPLQVIIAVVQFTHLQ